MTAPCRICGGSTVPPPPQFPDATQRVCWLGSNGMSWCGAGKVGKAHVFVGQPELPGIDEKPYDGELQRVTITQTPGKSDAQGRKDRRKPPILADADVEPQAPARDVRRSQSKHRRRKPGRRDDP